MVAGACATDPNAANDAACLDDFIQRFGLHALRRPLDADDVAFYRTVYGDDSAADLGLCNHLAFYCQHDAD